MEIIGQDTHPHSRSTAYPWAWNVVEVDDNNPHKSTIDSLKKQGHLNNDLLLSKFSEITGTLSLFNIQKVAIPVVFYSMFIDDRRQFTASDLCITAPTGSGKTFCYALPICDRLLSLKGYSSHFIFSVVLAPSKPLVMQVGRTMKQLCGPDMSEKIVILTDSHSFESEKRLAGNHKKCPNVVVSTPECLLNHLLADEEGIINLKFVDCLVLDEADKLLTSKNLAWTIEIMRRISSFHTIPSRFTVRDSMNPVLQFRPFLKILVSATISQNSTIFEPLCLFRPVVVKCYNSTNTEFLSATDNKLQNETDFERNMCYSVPKCLVETYVIAETDVKPLILTRLVLKLLKFNQGKILCFVNSLETASKVSFILNTHNQIQALEISSRSTWKKRKSNLKAFQNQLYNVLISTDATSRGMDFADIQTVINYDAPHHVKNYIHRVGRTARANQAGKAITIVSPTGEEKFCQMTQKISRNSPLVKAQVTNKQLRPLKQWFTEALELLKSHSTTQSK